MIQSIILSLVSAASYSIIFYIKKKESFDPEDFNKFKFGSTLLVGLSIGGVLVYTGSPITQEAIETQLVAYAGITALVESILKFVYRKFLRDRLAE